MPSYTDSLRGYGHQIYKRDNYTCRYCGADGRTVFEVWLTLSVDHLLPKGHPERDNPDYIVTACKFCNTADNHYFTKYGLSFDGLTPDQLVELRREKVHAVRDQYKEFWKKNVKPTPE
jgi:hypothetical protein